MNKRFLTQVLAFDLDKTFSEYGFATRLAKENKWTKNFTKQAILEYKKFMYLAATANAMVSPSEIVDIVWHQHLIFTQSYKDFGQLLGKKIEHIPSTHNRAEFEKFQQAQERTRQLYESHFGKQPAEIWNARDINDTIGLKKSAIQLSTIIQLGILGIMILGLPAFFLLRPIFIKIDNPNFISGYIILITIAFGVLELFNRNYFKNTLDAIKKEAFIFNLTPLELIFLQKKDLSYSIHGVINRLVEKQSFHIGRDFKLIKTRKAKADNLEEFQVIDTIEALGSTNYPTLLKHLVRKPVFANIENAMNSFKKYFNNTLVFRKVFILNFVVLSSIFLLGLLRFAIGIIREKPLFLIGFVSFVLLFLIISYLYRLTYFLTSQGLPNWYKQTLKNKARNKTDNQWDYFLLGTVAFTTSFIPLAAYTQKNGYQAASNTCGTGCGSSCGGGCSGGCGGGCGGCGG